MNRLAIQIPGLDLHTPIIPEWDLWFWIRICTVL